MGGKNALLPTEVNIYFYNKYLPVNKSLFIITYLLKKIITTSENTYHTDNLINKQFFLRVSSSTYYSVLYNARPGLVYYSSAALLLNVMTS